MVLALLDEAVLAGARLCAACGVLDLSTRTVQRWREQNGGDDRRDGPKSVPANKLRPSERKKVIEIATSPEFRDLSPKQIVPALADLDQYVASESTIYRVLREAEMMRHRAPSRPPHKRPEALSATAPNQIYSWDITYLRSPIRGSFFYLYLFLDIFSRKIVGWRVEEEENTEHSSELLARICDAEGVARDKVTLHSDNGGPMKGSLMVATMQKLGVTPSFSRPRVSNDNPYSESLFRTVKYRPNYPSKPFENIEAARLWVEGFVSWYNNEHLHSGIRFVTPADRHAGRDQEILARRDELYNKARQRHPERWSGSTRDWSPVAIVNLNPEPRHTTASSAQASS